MIPKEKAFKGIEHVCIRRCEYNFIYVIICIDTMLLCIKKKYRLAKWSSLCQPKEQGVVWAFKT
jgi:hypothetical protein